MPPTEGAPPGQRPRPVFLIIGALGLAVLLALWVRSSASQGAAPSNSGRAARIQAQGQGVAPSALNVRLDALKQPPPGPGAIERNPFRFEPKAPPPPPPSSTAFPNGGRATAPGLGGPPLPPQPPSIPPIPLKFMGTVERRGMRFAALTDGRGTPLQPAKEGDLVLGQYRVVKIGVESIVMEYADGRGRQTIPMRGQS